MSSPAWSHFVQLSSLATATTNIPYRVFTSIEFMSSFKNNLIQKTQKPQTSKLGINQGVGECSLLPMIPKTPNLQFVSQRDNMWQYKENGIAIKRDLYIYRKIKRIISKSVSLLL